MKMKEFEQDKTIEEWMTILNASANTSRNYKEGFKLFTQYTNKSPAELLQEAEQEIKDGVPMRERSAKKHIVGFRSALNAAKYAPGTIQAHLAGVKSFYREFDIELPRMSKASEKSQPLKKNQAIPSIEDIREVLKLADPMEAAIILVGLSSGLSANEIVNLKVEDFKKGYDPKTEITALKLRREKVGVDFVTFLTPEASRAVWDYLELRDRPAKTTNKKEIAEREKQYIRSDDDYLFCNRCVRAKYLIDYDEELRKFPQAALIQMYRRLSEKTRKVKSSTGGWSLIRSHNMRKYFYSTLINGNCPYLKAEFMLGHKIPKTQAAYFFADVDGLRVEYANFIPALTVSKEAELTEEIEIMKREQEKIDVLEWKIERMEAEKKQREAEEKENAELMQAVKRLLKNPEFIKNM